MIDAKTLYKINRLLNEISELKAHHSKLTGGAYRVGYGGNGGSAFFHSDCFVELDLPEARKVMEHYLFAQLERAYTELKELGYYPE